jgi:hypothetical protein
LYTWVITLNFLRVKALYDEFTKNFGIIKLPLKHEIKGKTKHRTKIKFQNKNINRANSKMSHNIYNPIVRKSIMNKTYHSLENTVNRDISVMKQSQIYINLNDINDDEGPEKITKMKDLLELIVKYGFLCFIGYMQDIILDPTSMDHNEEMVICTPPHLKQLKKLRPSKNYSNKNIM